MSIISPSWIAASGHGGIDGAMMLDFINCLWDRRPSPIDVYRGLDMTLPGILAYRSWVEGGRRLEVPDLSDPAARERYRNDHFRCPQGEAVREG